MNKIASYVTIAIIFLLIYGSIAASWGKEIVITPPILFASLLFNLAVMGGGAVLAAYLMYGNDYLRELRFNKHGLFSSILYGLLAAIFFLFLVAIVSEMLGIKEESYLIEEIASSLNIAFLFLIPLIAAISEELFFRGLIQGLLEKKMHTAGAILITSLLFSMAHLEYKATNEVIFTFLFAIILGYLIYKTKNIASPMAAHFIYNFIAILSIWIMK